MSPRVLVPLLFLAPIVANAGYTARFGTSEFSVDPVASGGSAAAWYGYDTTNPDASDTADGVEADNTGVFMLHEDAKGQISLIVLLDRYGSTDTGKVNLVFTGASGSTWAVMDDPRSVDFRDVAGTISDGWDVKWSFGAGGADGGVLTLAPGDFCVGIDIVRTSGLSSYEVVSPDGSGGFTRTTIPSSDWRDIELCSVPDTDGDGVADDDDDCPATPAGVTVDAAGCPLDGDDDGVPDYLDDCPGTAEGIEVDEAGCAVDSDEDGVDDEDDACPDTAAGEVVDDDGCSLADTCPCDDDWSSRGEYLSCVFETGKDFVDDGLMSRSEFKTAAWDALTSDCGRSEGSCGKDKDEPKGPRRKHHGGKHHGGKHKGHGKH